MTVSPAPSRRLEHRDLVDDAVEDGPDEVHPVAGMGQPRERRRREGVVECHPRAAEVRQEEHAGPVLDDPLDEVLVVTSRTDTRPREHAIAKPAKSSAARRTPRHREPAASVHLRDGRDVHGDVDAAGSSDAHDGHRAQGQHPTRSVGLEREGRARLVQTTDEEGCPGPEANACAGVGDLPAGRVRLPDDGSSSIGSPSWPTRASAQLPVIGL